MSLQATRWQTTAWRAGVAALLLAVPACGSATSAADAGLAAVDAEQDTGTALDLALDRAVALDAVVDGVAPDAQPPPRPVVFVHGMKGSGAEFARIKQRLVADGWPTDHLFAIDFADPLFGCNTDNAATIKRTFEAVIAETKRTRIDLVAHSMGTLSSRYFIKNLGGQAVVNTFVSIGGMHHGLQAPCLSPLDVCVWKELCASGPFVSQLNAPPATPGDLHWVSIFSTDDGVVPVESSRLTGAENIEISGPEHAGPGGLLEDPVVYQHVRRVLSYADR